MPQNVGNKKGEYVSVIKTDKSYLGRKEIFPIILNKKLRR